MADRKYWMVLFSPTTWREFLDAGASVYGLSDRYNTSANKTSPGDYLLCYVTGISQFMGLLEVTAAPYKGNTKIWEYEILPIHIKVKPIVCLPPEKGIPVLSLKERISFFLSLKNPSRWANHFRNSIREWKRLDAEVVIHELKEAAAHSK